MASTGYLLTIAGCPVVFTSPGIGYIDSMSSLPINHADWPYGISAITQVANGALDPNSIGDFSEELDLLNSNFNADGITFRVHDILMTYEGETVNIASKLFTSKNQETCQLAATYTADDNTGQFTVRGENIVPDTLGFVWINGEALEKDSISGQNVNVNTRGALGTRRQTHRVDSSSHYYPTIFLSYPGPYRQKVLLWRRDEDGNWSVLWRGVGGRAPRASGNGVPIELQCEHFWTDLKGKTYEVTEAKTKLAGWDARKLGFRIVTPTSPDIQFEVPSNRNIEYNERDYPSRYSYGLHYVWERNRATGQLFDGWTTPVGIEADVTENKFSLILPDGSPSVNFRTQLFGNYGGVGAGIDARAIRPFQSSELPVTSDQDAGKKKVFIPIPEWSAFQVFKNGAVAADNNHLIVDRVDSLEQFDIVNSGSINTCLTRTTWVGDIEAESYRNPNIVYSSGSIVSASFPSDPTVVNGLPHKARRMFYYCSASSYDWAAQNLPNTSGAGRAPLYFESGSAVFKAKNPADTSFQRLSDNFSLGSESWRSIHFVMQQVDLEHRMSLKSRHWLDLIRYGIIEKFKYDADFDFSFNSYMSLKLQNPSLTTELLLEPKTSVGDAIQGLTQYYGIAPTTTTEGKMRFARITKPSTTTSSSWTLTSNDYVKSEQPTWEDVGDNVVTTVVVSSDGIQDGKGTIINNQEARAKYGDVQRIEINMSKVGIEDAIFQREDAIGTIAADIQSNFFELFKDPYTAYTVHLPLSWMTRIYPGMVITVSDWLVPNSEGGRALASAKLLVQKKVTSLQTGKVSITGILFPRAVNTGFSPCVKISDVNVATKTLTVTSSYIATGRSSTESPTDYAGSNLAGYSRTANDLGINWFNPGDKVQFIIRDTATWIYQSYTIASVGSNTIVLSETINTGVVNWPAAATSGTLDLRFDAYGTSGLQVDQKTWAYLGDGTTRRIVSLAPIKKLR